MDRGAWEAIILGVAQSWTRLRDFDFTTVQPHVALGWPKCSFRFFHMLLQEKPECTFWAMKYLQIGEG